MINSHHQHPQMMSSMGLTAPPPPPSSHQLAPPPPPMSSSMMHHTHPVQLSLHPHTPAQHMPRTSTAGSAPAAPVIPKEMTVEEAERSGIPCIVPMRFQGEATLLPENKIVLKKSSHARSELTPTARLNLVFDADDMEKRTLREQLERLMAGGKRCIGHTTNEKYHAAKLAAHYQVSVATVHNVIKTIREHPVHVAPSLEKSTRGRKRSREDISDTPK